jgi:peptidoglycan/LPS O-acetylase OafA/YrhL
MNLPIQYLRGIAAILVVFAHFRFIPWLNGGAIGVDIFFILSGYIMSLTSAKYINNRLIFIKKRFIRVYPLYLFFLLIISFFYLLFDKLDINQFLYSFAFIGGIQSYKDPVLFSGWSLFYEIFFYLMVAIFIARKKILFRYLLIIGFTGLLFCPTNFVGYIINPLYLYFAIGIFIQIYEAQICSFKIFNHKKTNFYFSILLMCFVINFPDSGIPESKIFIPRNFISIYDIYIPRIIFWGLPTTYFLLSFLFYFKNKNELKILSYLGKISYSIYLVHTFIFLIWKFYLIEYEAFIDSHTYIKVLYFIIPLLLIMPLSHLSHKFIEINFSNFLIKLMLNKKLKKNRNE